MAVQDDDQRQQIEDLRARADFISGLILGKQIGRAESQGAAAEVQRLKALADELEAERDDEA